MYASSDISWNDYVEIFRLVLSDGKTWTITNSGNPLLERNDYFWTASEIRSPSALIYNNDLYLYFAGHYFDEGNPVLSIGLLVYDEY
jgi:hypothetical protein